MELIPAKTKFDFLGKRAIAFTFSFIMIVASFYIWFEKGDSKFGIDYLGGHEVVVKFDASVASEVNTEVIRGALKGADFNPVVQAFEAQSAEYSVRLASDQKSKEVRDTIVSGLNTIQQGKFEIIKADYVGPTIGKELQRNALIAVIVALLGIMLYITYRFEAAFAVGAVVALFHDVIITMGIYLFCDYTVNVATLAAALTIVGYSVNDTIIVFDRIREEIFRQKKYDLTDLINYSINATLSRTVITSLLTLFAALALLLYGGGAIADLSLFLFVGVIAGTYSTIFIASPVALLWEGMRKPAAKQIAKEA